jgi:hypothetical protein
VLQARDRLAVAALAGRSEELHHVDAAHDHGILLAGDDAVARVTA